MAPHKWASKRPGQTKSSEGQGNFGKGPAGVENCSRSLNSTGPHLCSVGRTAGHGARCKATAAPKGTPPSAAWSLWGPKACTRPTREEEEESVAGPVTCWTHPTAQAPAGGSSQRTQPAPQGPWEACGRRPQPFSHVPIPHVVTTDMPRGDALNPPEVTPPVLKDVRRVAGGRDRGKDSSPGTDPRAASGSLGHLAAC